MRISPLPCMLFAASSLLAQATQTANPATIKAQAKLVVVDVVVTDHGKPVHDLKQSDFSLTESGKPQILNSFEEHTAVSGKSPQMPPMPPGIFTNYVPTSTNQAVNILLLDALNTPMQDQVYVRQQLLEYLRSARPGTNTAIFGLSTKLVMLQGFTANPELLKSVLEKANSGASPLIDSPGDGGGMPDTAQDLNDDLGNDPMTDDVVARLQTFMDIQQSFQTMLRDKYTLDAMNVLARYLASIPGRKNLIWFSGSFPLNILPDVTDGPSFAMRGVANSEDEYRETTDLLARAQVAVYPIDARGLTTIATMAASNNGTKYARQTQDIVNDEQKFYAKTADEHATMTRMAEDTGGHAFYNTNGLTAAVEKAIDDGSNYYTLTYSPTNTVWKGDFRKIQVKLAKSGYTLEYRHHYFANDPSTTTAAIDATTAKAAPSHSPETINRAMIHGVPGSTQLLFKLRVLPVAGDPASEVAPENVAGQPKPPYRNYGIDFAVIPVDIAWTATQDGVHRASIEFISVVYQRDGATVTQTSHILNLALNEGQYNRIRQVGIPFHQVVSVPVKGSYSIRTAVHDLRSDRVGTTEFNVSEVKNIEPAKTQP